MVNQEETYVEQYWQRGWAVIEGIFEREEADRMAELALATAEKELTTAKAGYNLDASEDGTQQAPRKVDRPFEKAAEFRRWLLDGRLTQVVASLLRAKPLLLSDQIFFKPPRYGSAKPYHQDNFYFRCNPDDEVITSWIALDDVDEANGCLRYIDGSHRGPILPHDPVPGSEAYNLAPSPELIELSKESLAPVHKGGVVFHHSKTLHTSHRNQSDRWRRGYAAHWVTPAVTSETDVVAKAYFRSPKFAHLFT